MLEQPPQGRLAHLLGRVLNRSGARAARVPGEPPATKSIGPYFAFDRLGSPAWAPRDYSAFAREGFMQNAILYRSVRMIAEAAASVPLLLYAGDEEITSHPLLDLIARPSPAATAPDLLESWYGFLLVSGNAYLEAIPVGSEVRELHALRPDRMRVVPGADGWPAAFDYIVDGKARRLGGEVVPGVRRVLHLKLFHPLNDHYGLSPIEAAAQAVDIHNTASRWNKALLDNSARPSGALVYTARDGNLTVEQYDRLKAELEQGFQGAARAGRPLLLEGGLDWKSMSLSPKDMDFIEAKHVAAREIALALGVPPMLLGIPGDNTYSNYQEATRTFWRSTVLPLVTRTAKSLSAWLAPAYADLPLPARGERVGVGGSHTFDATSALSLSKGGLELRPDLDSIEALSIEREALWTRIDKATFLTQNEKRAAVGYGPIDGGDDFAPKHNPHHDELGRFTTAEGAATGGGGLKPVLVSDRGRPVDLHDEEQRGGHTIAKHVAKSEAFLLNRVRTEVYRIGTVTIGLRNAGSFPSVEAANKLVNSTLSGNPDVVEQVASGSLTREVVEMDFGSPTGYEAYRRNDRAQAIMRDTYTVRVVIQHDRTLPRGYRIITAYPFRRD